MLTMRQLAPVFFLTALGVAQADPANLVVNGGFETGDFTGWIVSGDVSPCLFVGAYGGAGTDGFCNPTVAIVPHGGSFAAYLGNNDADAYIAQTIDTSNNSGTYTVSFWL